MESESKPTDEVNEKMAAPATATLKAADEKSFAATRESKQLKIQPVPGTDAEVKSEVAITKPSEPSVQPSSVTTSKESAATVYTDDEIKSSEESIDFQAHQELARARRDEGYYANQMNPALMQSRVIGHVADAQSGAPIMSAKLAVDYSNQLFYTDIEGGFEIYIPQPAAV